jgi:hypothetical protein
MSAIASLAASSTSMTEETRPIEEIIQEICGLPTDLLGRISKQAVDEMGRRAKTSAKSKKAPKKTGSMPKGRVPDQLRKPREWVNHVKADAIANGWPSYTMHQTRKNKETGEREEEEIEMPGSEQNAEGVHVFEGSITEKLPKGRAFTHKDAMSLSAVYWKVKTQKGSRQDLYEEFDASYQEDDAVSQASDSSEKVVVRMTAAEKEAQKQEKAEEKEREKERKKQEKLDEKERKKEEKAAATGKQEAKGTPVKKVVKAVKAASAAASAAESAEIDADSISLSPVAASASSSASSAAASAAIPAATPVKLAKPAKPMAPKKAKKEEWTCPNDTLVHSWENDGVKLLRNFAGQVWMDDDGQLGEWVGLWNKEKKFLDTDAPAPEFEDE